MTAEAKVRFDLEVSGIGQEKKVSSYALLSDEPTQVTGTMVVALATTQALLDTLGVISGELLGLYIKSLTSGVWINPFGTAANTLAACYLPTNMWNFYTFQAATSCVPSVMAAIASSQIEYAIVGL